MGEVGGMITELVGGSWPVLKRQWGNNNKMRKVKGCNKFVLD
jgi:hypothetical protein